MTVLLTNFHATCEKEKSYQEDNVGVLIECSSYTDSLSLAAT